MSRESSELPGTGREAPPPPSTALRGWIPPRGSRGVGMSEGPTVPVSRGEEGLGGLTQGSPPWFWDVSVRSGAVWGRGRECDAQH